MNQTARRQRRRHGRLIPPSAPRFTCQHFRDTSRTAAPESQTPRTPRARIPFLWFFPRADLIGGGKLKAPAGYVFDGRGDLRSLKRIQRRAA